MTTSSRASCPHGRSTLVGFLPYMKCMRCRRPTAGVTIHNVGALQMGKGRWVCCRCYDVLGRPAEADRLPVYRTYLASEAWALLCERVRARDKQTCQKCEWAGGALDVHHLTYDRATRERLSDLVALCRPCHLAMPHAHRPKPD